MATSRSKVSTLDVRPQDTVPRPELTWNPGTYSLEEILQKFQTPCVIQCEHKLSNDVSVEKSNFDFLQPMLLYDHQECMKVTATTLNTDAKTDTATEVGDPLIIPEHYKGWFAVLGKSTKKIPNVPHYRQVSKLAQSDCEEFLIGGKEVVRALLRLNKQLPPETKPLYPGDVLRMGNVYIATTRVKTSRFSKAHLKESKFLFCTDQNDRELLIPFESSGLFYVVKRRSYGGKVHVPIQRIQDIIKTGNLPCVAKLVFGRLPSSRCVFTGLLMLKSSYSESSAVVSSIVNLRNILLELPKDIPLLFKVAVDNPALSQNKGYNDALFLCREKAITYKRSIKVCHGIQPCDVPLQPGQDNVPTLDSSSPQENVEESSSSRGSLVESKTSRSSSSGSYVFVQPTPGVQEGPETPSASNVIDSETETLTVQERVRCLGITTTQKPTPPSQSAKPPRLDRVVGFGQAPTLKRFENQIVPNQGRRTTSLLEPVGSTEDEENDGVYERPWIFAEGKTPPPPPPKCKQTKSGPKFAHKITPKKPSITIGVNNTYLSVPVYSDDKADKTSSVKHAMNLAEKIQFWNQVGIHNKKDPPTREKSMARTESFEFSEVSDSSPAPCRGPADNVVYENVDNLREDKDFPKYPTAERPSKIAFMNPPPEPAFVPDSYPEINDMYELPVPDPIAGCDGLINDSDSGIHDAEEDEIDENRAQVVNMSVDDVFNKLKELNVKLSTRELLKRQLVDGRMLSSLRHDELESAFPSISKIELMKIGLFIKGFRPS